MQMKTKLETSYVTEFSRILDTTPDDGKKEAIANILCNKRIARSDTHSLAKPFPGCLCFFFVKKKEKSSVKQKRELCLEVSRMSSVLFALPLFTVLRN